MNNALLKQLPLLACGALLVLLPACSPRSSTSGQAESTHSESSVVVTPRDPTATTTKAAVPGLTPTPTLTPAGEDMDPWPPTIGTVTQIGPGHEILLIEHPDNPNNGEQYIVTVLDDARISRLTANGPVPASFGDLRTGMRVAVILVGVVLDSYPALGTAGEVIILRTDTDGPADPEDIVTMEMDFYIVTGLFANQPPPPLNDAFVVSYAVAGGERGDLYFCGDRAGETEKCQDGPVYHLQLETPRGAELSYEVKRLPGRDKSRGELIESDRVIMDLDLATRSHYRYGASNPGGYN